MATNAPARDDDYICLVMKIVNGTVAERRDAILKAVALESGDDASAYTALYRLTPRTNPFPISGGWQAFSRDGERNR